MNMFLAVCRVVASKTVVYVSAEMLTHWCDTAKRNLIERIGLPTETFLASSVTHPELCEEQSEKLNEPEL